MLYTYLIPSLDAYILSWFDRTGTLPGAIPVTNAELDALDSADPPPAGYHHNALHMPDWEPPTFRGVDLVVCCGQVDPRGDGRATATA